MASVADLALAYLSQGKFTESDPLAREAMEFDRKKQPDDWQGFGPKACWAPAWLDRRNTPGVGQAGEGRRVEEEARFRNG
jgi:hypothetical protein